MAATHAHLRRCAGGTFASPRATAEELRVELKAQKRAKRALLRNVVVALTALLEYEQRNGDEPEALAALLDAPQT